MVLCSRELAKRAPGIGVFVADPFSADTGAILSIAGMLTLVYALVNAPDAGWGATRSGSACEFWHVTRRRKLELPWLLTAQD
jgi:hypothetical protein